MFGKLNSFGWTSKFVLKNIRSMSENSNKPIHSHNPNNLEKRFLVWSGKYKTLDEVPAHVSHEVMERCRNKIRIRVANIMMALTVFGCCIMVYSGKQAAKSGDSVTKQNLDWHKKYNEDSKKA
ncbi:UPF0389 protein CG9231 [Ceratitis capitata]|uniref:(Mediterranean fruit fly) hypothetical protein n=1 Tax=Ceratitis capitata TaxID=7213 RepID=A0A811UYG8_CERCA|nr:UPF0389 protein CG9231 [Ceratitis capitata]CAD7003358.1 unnamed protein product [Ceratitis capitata]